MSTSIKAEEGKDMDIKSIAHSLVLIIINLQELHVRIHLRQLTYLWFQKHNPDWLLTNIPLDKMMINWFCLQSKHQSKFNKHKPKMFGCTLGWRALQPPHPGEKKSTTTSLSPACKRESTRSWAPVTSFILGRTPFSHHFWAFPIAKPTCIHTQFKG